MTMPILIRRTRFGDHQFSIQHGEPGATVRAELTEPQADMGLDALVPLMRMRGAI